MLSPANRRDAILLLLAAIVTAVYVAAAGGGFPLDDSWIHQTYGRNLGLHGEWAYTLGVPSAASTSPLYTVVLAIGYAIGAPFAWWAHGIGAIALGISAILGARIAQRIAPDIRRLDWIAGISLIAAWHLVWAAASGMETMIFAMLTLVLIALGLREFDTPSDRPRDHVLRGAVFGIAVGITTLTRPEGLLLAGLIGISLVLLRPTMTWLGLVRYGGVALLTCAVIVAPYLLFNLQVTGGLLPNTGTAKRMDATPLFAFSYPWRVGYLLQPLIAGGQLLLVPGMIGMVVMAIHRRAWSWLLLPLWSIGLIALYAATLPLNIQHGRYLIPALPSAILTGVIGMAWLLRAARRALIGRVLSRTLALATLVVFMLFLSSLGLSAYVQDVTIIDQEMVTAALWLRDNADPDDLLAVHDIGAVGYFAPRPILDIAGLVSPEVIPIRFDADALWELMESRGAIYLMALENQVPGRDLSDPRLCAIFNTEGNAAIRAGGSNMIIYALTWDGNCPNSRVN